MRDVQADARAAPSQGGGEEGVENAPHVFWRNAVAVVGQAQDDMVGAGIGVELGRYADTTAIAPFEAMFCTRFKMICSSGPG